MTKEYCGDQALEARVSVIEAQLSERKEAVRVALDSLEKRLMLLNELRAGVMTVGEYSKAHDALTFRLEAVERTQSKFVGVSIALMALSALIGAVMSHLFVKP